MKLAIDYSDGIIIGSETVDPELIRYVSEKGIEPLPFQADFNQYAEEINRFYDQIDASFS
jgi:starch synthase